MAVKRFVNVISALRGFWRGRVQLLLHFRSGARQWRREAVLLLATLAVLVTVCFVTLHFASRAVQTLISTCTTRLEIEFELAEIEYPESASPRALCQCLAHALLEKNGVVPLALVEGLSFDPLNLKPVTEEDSQHCIDALWFPDIEPVKLAR
ncbi:hypothetical protein NHG95_20935 [Pseudomonas corrugata]|uniref:hypothetical protein n=1 Tax=Pseudomonas corrugata TaxID=47879 RepID=UPI0028C497B4|nr:hypothetical protein [Pseudomonas corrugata]MDU9025752.1 hypothetical protein [Pseudomonas corrugata]MDU9035620.1 hypothetical protein [Pseudomonas corrugata]